MQMSLILTVMMCAAVPVRAEIQAVPASVSAARVQYRPDIDPCFERSNPKLDYPESFPSNDDDCGRQPIDEPGVHPVPVPVPCPEAGCDPARRPKPDPCWYDDCPRGGGWDSEWRSQKEALHGGDITAQQNALNAMFDNMASMPGSGGVVYAGGGGKRLSSGLVSTPHFSAALGSTRASAGVPSPRVVGLMLVSDDDDANPMRHDNTVREVGTWGAGGAVAGATGGVAGAVLGALGGIIAGGADGYAEDMKDKEDRDDDSYRRGTEALEKTHEDYQSRQQEDNGDQ